MVMKTRPDDIDVRFAVSYRRELALSLTILGRGMFTSWVYSIRPPRRTGDPEGIL
jgi:hypothetical protein